mmetsp:Transcript_28445/g.39583  ORF Transcript_28445/g.39583 Transcript_28445/m.39583 type:complete len:733 (+) Transcript_28445:148-2346(+)
MTANIDITTLKPKKRREERDATVTTSRSSSTFSLVRLMVLAQLGTSLIRPVYGAQEGYNPCHRGRPSANNCTNVILPDNMCEKCLFREESFYGYKEMLSLDSSLRDGPATCDEYYPALVDLVESNGEFDKNRLGVFRNCARMYEIETDPCIAKMQEYVDINPCDEHRRDMLKTIKTCRAGGSCNGYDAALESWDFVLYATCEACCDCVEHTASKFADKDSDQYSAFRGNCYAHPKYDICKLYPNIEWLGDDSLRPDNPVKVCDLMAQFERETGTFLGKTFEFTLVGEEYAPFEPFLDTLWTGFQCGRNNVYRSCFDLECAQGRLGVKPTNSPTAYPGPPPTPEPTVILSPTANPTESPTESPTPEPTESPTPEPTKNPPTAEPTENPTTTPTSEPTSTPSMAPSTSPSTQSPTSSPTTDSPSLSPTSSAPTVSPSTATPSQAPATAMPTGNPSTVAPTTESPSTSSPETKAPATATPSATPTTEAPTTVAPTTCAPTTDAPLTASPTESPATSAPITASPATAAPSTGTPTSGPSPSPTVSPTSEIALGLTITLPTGGFPSEEDLPDFLDNLRNAFLSVPGVIDVVFTGISPPNIGVITYTDSILSARDLEATLTDDTKKVDVFSPANGYNSDLYGEPQVSASHVTFRGELVPESNDEDEESSSDDKLSTGVIAGVAVGAFFVLAGVVALVACCCWGAAAKKINSAPSSQSGGSTDALKEEAKQQSQSPQNV